MYTANKIFFILIQTFFMTMGTSFNYCPIQVMQTIDFKFVIMHVEKEVHLI